MHSSGEGLEASDLSLAEDGGERQAAYRTLFRSELDAKAAGDICQALQLEMPMMIYRAIFDTKRAEMKWHQMGKTM